MKVLFVDHFDSFTFNLVDEFARRGAGVEVWRSDRPAHTLLARLEDMAGPRLLVLSPGPGAPGDAHESLALVRAAVGRVPILGVCLGHQIIVEAFGGRVGHAGEVVHGKTAALDHAGAGLFEDVPHPMTIGRYHSLAAHSVPDVLQVTGRVGELVMAVRHVAHPVWGVQFHPESILTPSGGRLFDNALRMARAFADQRSAQGAIA